MRDFLVALLFATLIALAFVMVTDNHYDKLCKKDFYRINHKDICNKE